MRQTHENNVAALGGANALTKREQVELEGRNSAAVDREIHKKADALPAQLAERIDLLKQARASLDLATDLFRGDMIAFTDELPKHIKTLREWRMAMEREKDASLKALRELRTFFLEADHDKEMMRLSEFVRVAERLGQMAKDGTLDAVAEVMLKLSI